MEGGSEGGREGGEGGRKRKSSSTKEGRRGRRGGGASRGAWRRKSCGREGQRRTVSIIPQKASRIKKKKTTKHRAVFTILPWI